MRDCVIPTGLAAKNFIDVGAGVIDEDYRGNMEVVMFSHADQEFEVKKGDRKKIRKLNSVWTAWTNLPWFIKKHKNEHDEKESSLNGGDDGYGDDEIFKRIKSKVLCKQSNLKFGDVCIIFGSSIFPVTFFHIFFRVTWER